MSFAARFIFPGALIMSAATLAGLAYTFSGQLQRGLQRAVGSVANLLFLGALIGAVVGAWPSERSIALLAGVVGAVIMFGIPVVLLWFAAWARLPPWRGGGVAA